nr:DUF3021 domain-containing protein [Paenibacillus bovis]
MKKFITRSILGIFYGAFLAVIATNIVYFSGTEMLDGGAFFKNSLGFIFCGWFFTVTPLYFENENLQLWQQTALHFITVTILYFVLSLGIGWIPFELKSILIFGAIFIAGYAIFWTAFYVYYKNKVKKLNEDLQHI